MYILVKRCHEYDLGRMRMRAMDHSWPENALLLSQGEETSPEGLRLGESQRDKPFMGQPRCESMCQPERQSKRSPRAMEYLPYNAVPLTLTLTLCIKVAYS